MDWFLYDRDLRHEKVKHILALHSFISFPGGINLLMQKIDSCIFLSVKYSYNLTLKFQKGFRNQERQSRL